MYQFALLVLVAPVLIQAGGPSNEETLKELAPAIENLQHKFQGVREQAYLKLMSYRPLPKEVARTLAKMVSTETGDTRILAAAVLAEMTPQDASLVKPLEEGLASMYPTTKVAAMTGLARLGPLAKPASSKVLAAMETDLDPVRVAAIPVVANLGKEAVAPLEKIILKATEKRMKNDQAAVALGKIGSDAVPTILRLFDMDDPAVDYHAAMAAKSMDQKTPEVLKPMLRLARHKDNKVRRLAIDYLVEVQPPTPGVNDALWAGAEDDDNAIVGKCVTSLRARSPDKKRWVPILKRLAQRSYYTGGSSIAALHELLQIDHGEAEPLILPVTLSVVGYRQQSKARLAQLATLEKEIVPHLPKVYEILNRTGPANAAGRINVITFLTHLAPEHTQPVEKKLQADLKAPRWELKLIAAQALLRTKPADTGPLARAMAEALAGAKTSPDFRPVEVLAQLRVMGRAAKDALPVLRQAQAGAQGDLKAQILLTIATIDPAMKEEMAVIAKKMYQGTDKYAGAAVLLEFDALGADEALKVIGLALNDVPTQMQGLRLVETLGPKAKALAPRLEAMVAHPRNNYRTQSILALDKINGNRKQTLDRLVRLAREEPMEYANVMRAAALLGAEARPALTVLLDIGAARPLDIVVAADSLARIDPMALNRIFD